MVDIITDIPRSFTDGEIDAAFLAEIKSGFQLEKETEHERVAVAKKEAHEMKGACHPSLGRPIATMPARDFFRLTNKYGHKEVHSKEFLKYYQKKFPELTPNKI